MLDIDEKVFNENLLLTQAYCDLQLKNTYKNYASILRSFNPVYDGRELFTFKLSRFFHLPEGEYKLLTEWDLDPLAKENNFLYDDLFEKQLNHKKETITVPEPTEYSGKILIAEIDMVISDGVSEFESEGFIDYNDCPPIDTWFYITKEEGRRLLFAWIPEQFENYVDKGIEVNALNIFNWHKGEGSESNNWHDENLGEMPKAVIKEDENPPSIFSQIKKMLS